jgi:PPOX class probable F420-dependent enzyme
LTRLENGFILVLVWLLAAGKRRGDALIKANIVPEQYLDLFQKQAFAQLATLMPDGSPHVAPVWVDYDGSYVLVNTHIPLQKERNLRRDPRVALSIQDPDNPYRCLVIRGRVAEMTQEGAEEHIDRMAQKYFGTDRYEDRQPGEVRVLVKIEAEHITAWN